MELANNTLTAWFAMLRIIIILVCVNAIVMARFTAMRLSGYSLIFFSTIILALRA